MFDPSRLVSILPHPFPATKKTFDFKMSAKSLRRETVISMVGSSVCVFASAGPAGD